MEHAIHSFIPVIIIISAGIIGATIMKLLKITPILGFFIAGVLVGPSALNLVYANDLIHILAEVGVMLLLFDIGLHLSFKEMWRLRHELLILGPLQVFSAAAILGFTAYYLDLSWQISTIVGFGLALSSTAIVMQLLQERKQSNNPLGQTATAILIFQDIFIVFLLILVPALKAGDEASIFGAMSVAFIKAVVVLVVVYYFGKYVLQPLLAKIIDFAEEELFTAAILLVVLAISTFTGITGLSLGLGAFLAGLIIAETDYCYMVNEEIQPFRTLLLGLFFIAVGMSLDLSFLIDNWSKILLFVVFIMFAKIVTLAIVSISTGNSLNGSLQLSLWLSQAGEFGFILFGLAYKQEMLPSDLYQTLMVSISVTFLLTPLMILISDRISRKSNCSMSDDIDLKSKVLIIGFGAEGKNIARILHASHVPYLAIEPDLFRVTTARTQGFNVVLGNIEKTNLFKSVKAGNAKAVIFALDGDQNLTTYIKRLNKLFPELDIYVNSLEKKTASKISKDNVKQIAYDAKQNGVNISKAFLEVLGKDPDEIQDIIKSVIIY